LELAVTSLWTLSQVTCFVSVDGMSILYCEIGASRYRSNASSVPTSQPASEYMDPFTGASRYSGASQGPAAAPSPSTVLPIVSLVFLHCEPPI
jgi:hypothetical protein